MKGFDDLFSFLNLPTWNCLSGINYPFLVKKVDPKNNTNQESSRIEKEEYCTTTDTMLGTLCSCRDTYENIEEDVKTDL